ncbi:Choline-sulfatase [Minicystis rosea]|nr:Choline-sulfatase [Minicystis rosea]
MTTKNYPINEPRTLPAIDQVDADVSSGPPSAGTPRFARLRALARTRRRFAPLLLMVPILLVVLVDAGIRGGRLLDLGPKYLASYAAAMIESALLWGVLLYTASARRGVLRWVAAVIFVILATVAMGSQIYFHRQYSIYLNLDATLFGTSLGASLAHQLKADGKNFLLSNLPPLFLAAALVWIGRAFLRPVRGRPATAARLVMPAAVVAVFLIPCSYRKVQASTPDVIYFHAIGGLIKQLTGVRTTAQIRPGLRTPVKLPALTPAPARKRNVVFILTESVRSDAHCSAYAETCPNAPEANAAAPKRYPLLQARSNSSTTAIQLAVLWSGLQPSASREALHSAPLVYDYAKAAGVDNAYWTSHHMMFANSRLFVQDLPTDHQCGATDLDPLADIDLGGKDELLNARVQHEMPTMHEPFLGVVHYGNTHVPYRVDPAVSPFQPSLESKAPSDNEAYRNYYKNAVFLQDRTIGEMIRWIRKQPFGDRTVIVFTSDHGEAFREHGQLGHTGAVLDEEIHVPFWIDAPPGTLTDEEAAALGAAREQLAFHTDVTPTILDLLGLWDTPALARQRAAMVGSSLLRKDRPTATLDLTNCSGIWGCAFRNWGMMRGSKKLEGREWDNQWHCYDVLTDPREEHDLGPAACGDLSTLADRVYGGLPNAH